MPIQLPEESEAHYSRTAALDGTPRGQDWQTWSAAMYLYAATSVERCETPFFKEVRNSSHDAAYSGEQARREQILAVDLDIGPTRSHPRIV